MFSQVKKNESALERIRGYQGEMQIHPRKMKVYQIERTKKIIELSAANIIPIRKKEKKKKKTQTKKDLARLKTQKGGLGKIRA